MGLLFAGIGRKNERAPQRTKARRFGKDVLLRTTRLDGQMPACL